jgi:hypothetical protein
VTRTLLLLTFVAFILVPATNAAAPVVPVRTQAQIAKARPALAYAPTRMVIGFRFRSWRTGLATVYERFTNKAGWEITFVSAPLRGLCRAGSSKTFQLDGNKVLLEQDRQGAAGLAVRPQPRRALGRLVAASPQPPTKLAASGLGRVVASATRI